jgi:galactan 5-O-arabinofuranosyltransferase
MRNALATVGLLVIAPAIAAAVSVISLTAIARVQWPAYPSSNQLHALTTVGQVGCILGLLCAGWVSRRGHRTVAQQLALVFVSAFSVVTLGMPLGATKLYLFGISVDQQFRTEYLTRLTDSSSLHDMTYTGLPPFYPPGWFWVGGRIAALTGTPGWEMFKPWAITSITIAIAVALVLWSRMIRFEYALIVTTATAAVTLAYSSPEPYSAMITVLLPPVFILTWSGLRGGIRVGGWAAVIGAGLFLGVAATCYTLLTAYSAFTMVLMSLTLAAARWRDGLKVALDPMLRLVVIGAIAAAVASITWLPFLLRAAHDPVSNSGSAFHYLPADGAELTFPMLRFTLLGALCLIGTLWLIVRARTSVRAGGLAVGVLAIYAWSLLSMLSTLARTTLLSFRLQPTLTVLLTSAAVFGFVEGTRALADGRRSSSSLRSASSPAPAGRSRAVLPVAAAIGLTGAIAFAQDIPDVLRPDLTIAYTDTDGHGQRGDRRPPSSEKFYGDIDAAITRATGKPRDQTVVLTADYSFLSYYPYYGFQGLTSHYANPLAQFDKRAAAIKDWGKLKTADPFVHALDTLPWAAPTVFLMRHGGSAGESSTYTLRLAEDVYPNQPNVRRYTVELSAAIFDDPRFSVTKIGPFVLAIRKP